MMIRMIWFRGVIRMFRVVEKNWVVLMYLIILEWVYQKKMKIKLLKDGLIEMNFKLLNLKIEEKKNLYKKKK